MRNDTGAVKWLVTAVLLVAVTLGVACDGDDVPEALEGESRAAVLPLDVHMIAGSRHDVVIAACASRIEWPDIISTTVFGSLFVAAGRLDLAYYTAEAAVAGAIPSCEPVSFSVHDARIEGGDFELEPTANPAAFHIHALSEGDGTFRATVIVEGQSIDVESAVMARHPNRVEFTPQCDPSRVSGDAAVDDKLLAGSVINFEHRLWHDDVELSGYGFTAFDTEALEILGPSERQHHQVRVRVNAQPGLVQLRTPYDDNFAYDFEVITPADFDGVAIESSPSTWFVDVTPSVVPRLTVDGDVSCRRQALEVSYPTPTICKSGSAASTALVDEGLCQIRFAFPDTSLTADFETWVYPGFERVDLPEPPGHRQGRMLEHLWVENGEYFVSNDARWLAYTVDGGWNSRTFGEDLAGIAGAGGHVFVAGASRTVWQFDGTQWHEHAVGGGDDVFKAVWARSPDDVYLAGGDTVFHYDGDSWDSMAGPAGEDDIAGVWAPAQGSLHVLGSTTQSFYRYDGAQWTDVVEDGALASAGIEGFRTITARLDDEVWLSSPQDDTVRFDGTQWRVVDLPLEHNKRVDVLWPVAEERAFILRLSDSDYGDFVRFWDGTQMVTFNSQLLPRMYVDAKFVTGEGFEVYVLNQDSVYRIRHEPRATP